MVTSPAPENAGRTPKHRAGAAACVAASFLQSPVSRTSNTIVSTPHTSHLLSHGSPFLDSTLISEADFAATLHSAKEKRSSRRLTALGVSMQQSVVKAAVEKVSDTAGAGLSKSPNAAKGKPPAALGNLLRGVVAHVDVRTENHNKSAAVEKMLLELGAKVERRLNSKVTHVVFKDGSKKLYDNAKRQNLRLVAVRWIEACKEKRKMVKESEYPPVCAQEYDSPLFPDKPKRVRILNARDYEDEMLHLNHLVALRRKRMMKEEARKNRHQPVGISSLANWKNGQLPTVQEILNIFPPTTPEESVRRLPGWKPNDPFDTPFAKRLLAMRPRTPSVIAEVTEDDSDIEIIEDEGSKLELSGIAPVPEDKADGEVKSKQDNVSEAIETVASGGGTIPDCGSNQRKRKRVDDGATAQKKVKLGRRKLVSLFQSKLLEFTPPEETFDVPAPENGGTKENKAKGKKEEKQVQKAEEVQVEKKKVVLQEVNPKQRRSSEDFIQPKRKNYNRRKTDDPSALRSLFKSTKSSVVCTSVTNNQNEAVRAVIKALGGFMLRNTCDITTTHIVTGVATRRTLNMLRGLARGCWIVSLEWVYKSMEARKWLDEEPFEALEFSPAVRVCRQARQQPNFKPSLFSNVGALHVSRGSSPPSRDLEELVEWCGGSVKSVPRGVELVVGGPASPVSSGTEGVQGSARRRNLLCVSEKWVLDSIHENTLQPLEQYSLKVASQGGP